MKMPDDKVAAHFADLAANIKQWSHELGFQYTGITDKPSANALQHLDNWLEQGFHGEMGYLERNRDLRVNPELLQPGCQRILSFRMDYLVAAPRFYSSLKDRQRAFISRYALGRDYHKLIKSRLKQLVQRIEQQIGPFKHRPLVDSAPVLEKALAEQAGLGWIGKNTLLLTANAGSFFFLAELLVELPLPLDAPYQPHPESGCGNCTACIRICPTQALVAPYQLDARRCISYLTIELQGSIPIEFRSAIGNRVYGCDDCQLICPWNRFAQTTLEQEFASRHQLGQASLIQLFSWTETEFLSKTEGSAIRRLGYQRWLRNLAVGLGNAPATTEISQALTNRLSEGHPDWLNEHFDWALSQQQQAESLSQQRFLRSLNKLYPEHE